MDERKKARIDRVQNITILLLTFCAIILLFYSFSPVIGLDASDLISRLFPSQNQSAQLSPGDESSALTAPVRLSVTGAHGRYGCATTLADEALVPLNTLLGEAFGSAGEADPSTDAAFRAALSSSSVYYDLTTPVPLPVLCTMLQSLLPTNSGLSAQRLLLSSDGESVRLFLFDGEAYFLFSTAIAPGSLEAAIAQYEPNDTAFLFERSDFDHKLEPYTLITENLSTYTVYNASTIVFPAGDSALLATLGFNANSNSRYTESGGTEVIFGTDATLRLEPDGTVSYAGHQPGIPLFQAGQGDSSAAVSAAYRLCSAILAGQSTNAVLYLHALQATPSGYVVSFHYMLDGLPVRFHDGSPAAEVTISDGVITDFTIRCRSYSSTGESGRSLPLTQALAIARGKEGVLSLAYIDSGSEALHADWIVE